MKRYLVILGVFFIFGCGRRSVSSLREEVQPVKKGRYTLRYLDWQGKVRKVFFEDIDRAIERLCDEEFRYNSIGDKFCQYHWWGEKSRCYNQLCKGFKAICKANRWAEIAYSMGKVRLAPSRPGERSYFCYSSKEYLPLNSEERLNSFRHMRGLFRVGLMELLKDLSSNEAEGFEGCLKYLNDFSDQENEVSGADYFLANLLSGVHSFMDGVDELNQLELERANARGVIDKLGFEESRRVIWGSLEEGRGAVLRYYLGNRSGKSDLPVVTVKLDEPSRRALGLLLHLRSTFIYPEPGCIL